MLQAPRFLTVIAGRGGDTPGRWVFFFPVIGALLGWLAGWVLGTLTPLVGTAFAALMLQALLCAITGARQERGVLRCLGQFGVLAVLFLTVVRWYALIRLPHFPILEMIVALALGRTVLVGVAWLARPVGDDVRLGTHMTTPGAIAAIVVGVVIAFSLGPRGVIAAMTASLLTSLQAQWFDESRGGVDTAGLHASSLFAETLALSVISCRNCIW